jgi:hypothetical protein
MKGDDRVRTCTVCELHVYNLGAMIRMEAEAFLDAASGRVCVRLFRRRDGTILTRDCPIGEEARNRRLRLGSRLGSLLGLMAGTAALPAFLADRSPPPFEGTSDSDEDRIRAGWTYCPPSRGDVPPRFVQHEDLVPTASQIYEMAEAADARDPFAEAGESEDRSGHVVVTGVIYVPSRHRSR